ncbi:MAG: acetoacetate--CoA ligase, partial [Gammaproteobacteria bacterium HGW-Gammaproteobacteria-14]
MNDNTALWTPSQERREASRMQAFIHAVNARYDDAIENYSELHHWSVSKPEAFWSLIWEFCGIQGDGPGDTLPQKQKRFQDYQWFPGAQLNFAENLLTLFMFY